VPLSIDILRAVIGYEKSLIYIVFLSTYQIIIVV